MKGRERGGPEDHPPPRTKWTRRVPHPVLIGHAASRLLGVKGRERGGPEDVEAEPPEVPPAGVGIVPDLLAPRTLSDAAASHVRFFSPPVLGPE